MKSRVETILLFTPPYQSMEQPVISRRRMVFLFAALLAVAGSVDGLLLLAEGSGNAPLTLGGDRLSLREHPPGGRLCGGLRVYSDATRRSPRPTAGTRWAARFLPSGGGRDGRRRGGRPPPLRGPGAGVLDRASGWPGLAPGDAARLVGPHHRPRTRPRSSSCSAPAARGSAT